MREAINAATVMHVSEPLSVNLEIAKFAYDWRQRYGDGSILLFSNVIETPNTPLLLDIMQRRLVLHSLTLDDDGWQGVAMERLKQPGVVATGQSQAEEMVHTLGDLPILKHQPGDIGKYVTSAVTAIRDATSGRVNLGCYRIHVLDDRRCTIFLDPRTDGYAMVQQWREIGQARVPVTIFLGGPLATILCGAAALTQERDDYEVVSSLQGRPIHVDNGEGYFPPAPVDAEIVIRGYLGPDLATEGPFGEFKGYYSTTTQSPVLHVQSIKRRSDAIYPALLCGKAAGLTLMSMQNELLMYQRLINAGFTINHVSNPIGAFGEYLTFIETPDPSEDVLRAAMQIDKRLKALVVSAGQEAPLFSLSKSPFVVTKETYTRHGRPEGDRIGVVIPKDARYTPVEW